MIVQNPAQATETTDKVLDTLINLGSIGGFIAATFIYFTNQLKTLRSELTTEYKEQFVNIQGKYERHFTELESSLHDLSMEIKKQGDDIEKIDAKGVKNFFKLYDKHNQVIRVVTGLKVAIEVNEQQINDLFGASKIIKRRHPQVIESLKEVSSSAQLKDLILDQPSADVIDQIIDNPDD